MLVDIVVPNVGESISEGTVTHWSKALGAAVSVEEPLVEIETDKASVEVPAPAAGVLREVLVSEGEDVEVGSVLGRIEVGATSSVAPAEASSEVAAEPAATSGKILLTPAARKIATEQEIDLSTVAGTGKRGQIVKEDLLRHLAARDTLPTVAEAPVEAKKVERVSSSTSTPVPVGEGQRRVPMTRLRRRIAERLVEAQHTSAILTTFNEIDMAPVMELRSEYKAKFLERHNVKLGFMGFFVKAAIEALKDFPALNASVDGTDIVYSDRYHIGVAVSSDRGLVVPVLRDADAMSIADVERKIGELAGRARERRLLLDDLAGGTFTISNGGVFGSMLSTPILNPPQSGILGMHNIVRRPVVVGDEIVIRPIMYLALSYDHRIIDGREAVQFLVRIKQLIEDPRRLLLEI